MSSADEVARILADWEERRGEGDAVAPEALISRHPELADELRSHFAFLGIVEAGRLQGRAEPGVPERVGDFRIVQEIGRGGMGVVYEAEQVSLGRRVALKILSLTFASTPKARLRFEREARAASSLHHTNLVPIFAMGEHAGHWYYAMELVRGRSLHRILESLRQGAPGDADGPFSTVAESTGARRHAAYVRVAEAFAGVAEALQTAHEAGIVHRDVKPANLLLDGNGVLKIVDFGLAWQQQQEGQSALTRTGDLIGTPAYMSPEQTRGETGRIDRRADVYSLGATLYEVLALEPPFRGENVGELYEAILAGDPVPPGRRVPHVPRDLQTIVLKAMEKDPARRYDTAAAMARDLRAFAAGAVVSARPVGLPTRMWRWARRHRKRVLAWAGGATLLVLGVIFAVAAGRADRARRDAAYERLLAEGTRSVGFFAVPKNSHTAVPVGAARALYRDAAALVPERPEAHWLLGILGGASTEERLEHLAVAHEHGLPARAWHLARAHVLSQAKRWDDVSQERDLASKSESQGAADAFLEAMLLHREIQEAWEQHGAADAAQETGSRDPA